MTHTRLIGEQREKGKEDKPTTWPAKRAPLLADELVIMPVSPAGDSRLRLLSVLLLYSSARIKSSRNHSAAGGQGKED